MSTTIERAPELLRRDVSVKGSRGMLRKVLLVSGIGASLFYVAANVLGPMKWRATARWIKPSASCSPSTLPRDR
jgi:hypothetical protein